MIETWGRPAANVAPDLSPDGPFGMPGAARGSLWLRRGLVLLDILALAGSWVPTLALVGWTARPGVSGLHSPVAALVLTTLASVGLIASQRLYRARVCGVPAVELALLWRVALLCAVLDVLADRVFELRTSFPQVALRAVLTFVLLTLVRAAYRSWLKSERRKGRFSRPVLIAGTNDQGLSLYRLLRDHPELGFRVVGMTGSDDPELEDEGVRWFGHVTRTALVARRHQVTGVLVAATALTGAELNGVTRQLLKAHVHVHLSVGLQGISFHRMSPTSLAHESLLYVEKVVLNRWQTVVKRGLDIALAAVGLILMSPALALAAMAIKAQDGGQVVFRQRRVGRDGHPFTMYKLRTMVPDAEIRLEELSGDNQRTGPLFKLARDPRVTRVGRFLRATSLDELPQLVNVLEGHMSLVGPRPALPREAAQFDRDLRMRQDVQPGITGLWQLEARDHASFEAYQRLDLYYVENWSVLFDLAILASTVHSVLLRGARVLISAHRRGADPAEPLTEAVAAPVVIPD